MSFSTQTSSRPLPSVSVPRKKKLHATRAWTGVLFALPVVAFELMLLILPILQTFYYSFTSWNGITSSFIGFQGYVSLLTNPTFWRILENNAALLLSIPIAIILPLTVAFILEQRPWGWNFFRSAFYLPTVISWVVIGMVAVLFFARHGILNHVLALFGTQQNMLGHPISAMISVIITFIWSVFGINMVIFIGGMATLPRELYEAARVDGAYGWQILWHVTIPLLKRFIQFAFILTLITAFTALFSLIFVMTGGGPGFGTTTLEFFVYEQAFNVGQFGYAATLGVFLFLVMFASMLFQIRLLLSGDDN